MTLHELILEWSAYQVVHEIGLYDDENVLVEYGILVESVRPGFFSLSENYRFALFKEIMNEFT
jgi:hypothetical protein